MLHLKSSCEVNGLCSTSAEGKSGRAYSRKLLRIPANTIVTRKGRIYGHEIEAPLAVEDGRRMADLLKPEMAIVLIIACFMFPKGRRRNHCARRRSFKDIHLLRASREEFLLGRSCYD